jgi:hypothetical protein
METLEGASSQLQSLAETVTRVYKARPGLRLLSISRVHSRRKATKSTPLPARPEIHHGQQPGSASPMFLIHPKLPSPKISPPTPILFPPSNSIVLTMIFSGEIICWWYICDVQLAQWKQSTGLPRNVSNIQSLPIHSGHLPDAPV